MTKLCWRATRRTIALLGGAAAPPRRTAPRRTAPHRTACRTRLNPTTRPNPFLALHSALRLTSMRHMPPFIAKIGEALWRAAYDKLPPLCKTRLPNVCVMQTYSRRRGDFMDYHTDSRQTYAGQKIAQDPRTAPPRPAPPRPHPHPQLDCRPRRITTLQ